MPKSSDGKKFLAGSNNAAAKWGFDSPSGAVLTSVPKLAGQYFVKMYGEKNLNHMSGKVKNVSEVTVQMETQSVDRYGKRVHVPTRVDFPSVTITLYDTVDGETFKLVSDIYEKYFFNNYNNEDSGNIDSTIRDVNSGRKSTSWDTPEFHFFNKIEIYHFFGQGQRGELGSYFGAKEVQRDAPAKIQKIVLINPMVTAITFDQNDYSTSEVKTIQLQLQPENVFVRSENVSVDAPDWMEKGMSIAREVLLNGDSPRSTPLTYEELTRLYEGLDRLGIQTDSDTFTAGGAEIPSFGNLVANNPGARGYGGDNILDAFQDELINAVFNGKKFSMKNIGQNVLQGILGNKGLSDIQSLKPTSTSRFGFIGDIVRDGVRNSLLNNNTASPLGGFAGIGSPTVGRATTGSVIPPSAPQPASPQQQIQGQRVISATEIGKIKEITNKPTGQ